MGRPVGPAFCHRTIWPPGCLLCLCPRFSEQLDLPRQVCTGHWRFAKAIGGGAWEVFHPRLDEPQPKWSNKRSSSPSSKTRRFRAGKPCKGGGEWISRLVYAICEAYGCTANATRRSERPRSNAPAKGSFAPTEARRTGCFCAGCLQQTQALTGVATLCHHCLWERCIELASQPYHSRTMVSRCPRERSGTPFDSDMVGPSTICLPSVFVGKPFSADHALNCKIGGYPCIRHNQVRDLLASLMKEVCTDVRTEPELQPLTGEVFNRATTITTDEARLDIEARGFWECRQECTMFDVRVFNPCADSYRHAPLSTLYRRQEQLKRNAYEERVRQVEKASFVPLVFTTSGSASPAATVVLIRLAARLAEARDLSYSTVMGWLRCRLSFCLLRCAVMCFRGSRSRRTTALENVPNFACSAATVNFAAWVCLFHFVRSTSCFVCLPSFLLSLRLVLLFCFVIFCIYCLLFVSLTTENRLTFELTDCRLVYVLYSSLALPTSVNRRPTTLANTSTQNSKIYSRFSLFYDLSTKKLWKATCVRNHLPSFQNSLYRLTDGSISGLLRKRATTNHFTRASCHSWSSKGNTSTTVWQKSGAYHPSFNHQRSTKSPSQTQNVCKSKAWRDGAYGIWRELEST